MASKTNSEDISLKNLAEQIFGTKVVDILKSKKMAYRDIWETSSPTTQCGKIIGSANNKTPCWLCGYNINNLIEAFKPECEHVLPVGQALIYLDLYKHTVHKDQVTKDLKDMLMLEYRWSHSVCNRIKSDTNFLSFDSNGDPIILDKVIDTYLTKVYDDSSEIKDIVGRGKQQLTKWKIDRLADISKQLQQIIVYMTKKTAGLLLLSGVASLFEPANIAASLRDTITPEKAVVIPNIEILTSSLNISQFRRLRFFIEYRSNLTSSVDLSAEILSKNIATAIKEKDTDSKFIIALRDRYGLTRAAEYKVAIKELILVIVRDHFIQNFEKVMDADAFKGVYYTYSYFSKNGSITDLFNPFILELINLCILCLIQKETISYPKLKGSLNEAIDSIQRLWLARCKDEDYKLFFCRTMELYTNNGVISKEIVQCVHNIDCSRTATKMENMTKIKLLNSTQPPVIVVQSPKSNGANMARKSANNSSKKNASCPVCPSEKPCPSTPACNSARTPSKTMMNTLLDAVEQERASASKFGGKAKRLNVNFKV